MDIRNAKLYRILGFIGAIILAVKQGMISKYQQWSKEKQDLSDLINTCRTSFQTNYANPFKCKSERLHLKGLA